MVTNEVIEETLDEFHNIDPITKWELIKMRISEKAIEYSRNKARQRGQYTQKLRSKIKQLEYALQAKYSESQVKELQKAQQDLEDFYQKKANSVIFRSRAKWVEDGEKSTKYFFNLEKANYRYKTVHQLEVEGQLIKDSDKILQECGRYYKELYSAPNHKTFLLVNTFHKTISNEKNEELVKLLSIKEIGEALSKFKDDKAPGCDGLPAEIYKIFWSKIKLPLLEYFRECLKQGKLGSSARRGVLTLIPKKQDNLAHLANWRPLTMLNMDYKIYTKMLALRIQPALPDLISDHQSGFMKERNIMDNVRKTLEVISYAKKHRLQKIIFSLDFHKCFDSCKVSALLGSLRFFGIDEGFIEMVAIIFRDFQLTVQNNGVTAPWFDQKVGCRQGCCYSPLAFILAAEAFSLYLTHNEKIKGIDVYGFQIILSQFADDTDLFLSYDVEELEEVTNTLQLMESQIGLKVNIQKSLVYRLGVLNNTVNTLPLHSRLKWVDHTFSTLGITICENKEERGSVNFGPLIDKVRNTLQMWKTRQLTLTGRVLIVNTLIESLFVYKMSVLEIMPDE